MAPVGWLFAMTLGVREMNVSFLTKTGFFVLVAGFGWLTCHMHGETAFGQQSSSETSSQNGPELSINSCKRCHGVDSGASAWERVFSRWENDPHSQAYSKLLSKDSQRIVASLSHGTLDVASPEYKKILREQCVSCHANETTPDSQIIEHGVDCFVCHGPPNAWGKEHYSDTTDRGSQRFEGTLRRNMKSLVERAKMCSSCHVGELNRGPGLQDREVDHRLMAAGHPPTYFDFEHYLERYLKHWDMKKENEDLERDKKFPPYERWRVGKLVSAQVRLELLQDRAKRAMDGASSTPHEWPELTEYSCSNCHHQIDSQSWRQQVRSSNAYTWDEWYLEGIELAWPGADDEKFVKPWRSAYSALKSSMESRFPDPKVILEQTRTMIDLCKLAIETPVTPDETLLREQLRSLLEDQSKVTSWEQGAQWATTTRMLSDSLGWNNENFAKIENAPERGFFGTPRRFNALTELPAYESTEWFRPDALSKYRQSLQQQLGPKP